MQTQGNRLQLLFISALLPAAVSSGSSPLNYSCEQLAQMAVRFYGLKSEGYELNDVLEVIQSSAANNREKEALLSEVAIEIYVSPGIDSGEQARGLALGVCDR